MQKKHIPPEPKYFSLGPRKQGFLSPARQRLLKRGEDKFYVALQTKIRELKKSARADPKQRPKINRKIEKLSNASERWITGTDFGRVSTELWNEALYNKKRPNEGPMWIRDILQHKGVLPPSTGHKFILKPTDLMDPRDVYPIPIFNKRGKYIGTVIHVGMFAPKGEIEELADSLLHEDPTGKKFLKRPTPTDEAKELGL